MSKKTKKGPEIPNPKSCPFCGSKKYLIDVDGGAQTVVVTCLSCQARGPTAGIAFDAVNYWNERR